MLGFTEHSWKIPLKTQRQYSEGRPGTVQQLLAAASKSTRQRRTGAAGEVLAAAAPKSLGPSVPAFIIVIGEGLKADTIQLPSAGRVSASRSGGLLPLLFRSIFIN